MVRSTGDMFHGWHTIFLGVLSKSMPRLRVEMGTLFICWWVSDSTQGLPSVDTSFLPLWQWLKKTLMQIHSCSGSGSLKSGAEVWRCTLPSVSSSPWLWGLAPSPRGVLLYFLLPSRWRLRKRLGLQPWLYPSWFPSFVPLLSLKLHLPWLCNAPPSIVLDDERILIHYHLTMCLSCLSRRHCT